MKNRNVTIDIIKFIMAVILVFHHYQQITGYRRDGINFYGGDIIFGYLVEMFFLLSGFFAAKKINIIRKQSFSRYFIGKVFRIYPMSILSVLVCTILSIMYKELYGEWFFDIPITLWKTLASILLIFQGSCLNEGLGVNNPLWYLCVLMVCYIIFYYIVWTSSRNSYNEYYIFGFMIAVGLAVLQYDINYPFLNSASARGYSAFFWGVLLYSVWNIIQDRQRGIKIGCLLFLLFYVFLLFIYNIDKNVIISNQREVLTFIIFPGIVLFALEIDSIWNLEFLHFLQLGNVSFEIYIWHYVGLIVLSSLEKKGYFMVCSDRVMIGYTVIMVALAYIIYIFVENPVNTRIKKLLSDFS